MNPEIFDQFLTGVIGVCAIGAILNLLMIRKRGTNAILMSMAFLVLGFAVTLYWKGASTILVGVMGAVVLGLLIADLVLKSKARSGS